MKRHPKHNELKDMVLATKDSHALSNKSLQQSRLEGELRLELMRSSTLKCC